MVFDQTLAQAVQLCGRMHLRLSAALREPRIPNESFSCDGAVVARLSKCSISKGDNHDDYGIDICALDGSLRLDQLLSLGNVSGTAKDALNLRSALAPSGKRGMQVLLGSRKASGAWRMRRQKSWKK